MSTSLPLIAQKSDLFGLDIGAETIKAVQLQRKRGQISLRGAALGPLPPGLVSEGTIQKPKELAEHIRSLIKTSTTGQITASSVSSSLPASRIFTRLVTLPKLRKGELREAISLEVEQSIPIPATELYLDYATIGHYREGREYRQDVLIAAAPKRIVESYLELFKELHLLPFALETELEPISRAISLSARHNSPKLITDIGAEATDFSIVVGGGLRLTGSVPVGGTHFTEAIAKGLKLKPEQAEALKLRNGLNGKSGEKTVLSEIEPLLENITTELRRMLRFYQDRSSHDQPISEVLLSGGSSSLTGLDSYLSGKLSLRVAQADPWQAIKTSHPIDRSVAPLYTTAIGLALGGFDANH